MTFDWITALVEVLISIAKRVVKRLGLDDKRTNRIGEVRRADKASASLAARKPLSPIEVKRRSDRHRFDVEIEREVVICSHSPL